jgi:hypothetical protein
MTDFSSWAFFPLGLSSGSIAQRLKVDQFIGKTLPVSCRKNLWIRAIDETDNGRVRARAPGVQVGRSLRARGVEISIIAFDLSDQA